MTSDISKLVVRTWRYGSELLKYSLLALIIPLFLVGFDQSGTKTFTWEEFRVETCQQNTGQHVYSKMCRSNIEKIGTLNSADVVQALNAGNNDFDVACTAMVDVSDQTSKVQVTQTLKELCIRFDSNNDPYEDVHICVETDDMIDGGGYVSGYLYWTTVISWMIVSSLVAYLLWERIYHGQSFGTATKDIMNHLSGMLHVSILSNEQISKGKGGAGSAIPNWLSHSLIMAFIHTFSVILAVYASLAHKFYDDEDKGMSIDAVTEKTSAKMFEDENDYQQRTGDCFNSVQAFYTFNVAQRNIDKDIDDAPAETQAVFVLSIIIAALSGLILFSYLTVLLILRDQVRNGRSGGIFAGLRESIVQAQTATDAEISRLKSRIPRFRMGRGSEQPSSSVGASVQDTGLFNLSQAPATPDDVPDSVKEEKNGELFTKNVEVGANIMKLTF